MSGQRPIVCLWFLCFYTHFLVLRPSAYANLSSRNFKFPRCFSWDIYAFGWSLCSTRHSWVFILPKQIFLAVALNNYSYYLFSAAVNQYCQIVLMQLCS